MNVYCVLVYPLMTCCLGVRLLSIYTMHILYIYIYIYYRYLICVYTDHLIFAVLGQGTEDQYELSNVIALLFVGPTVLFYSILN